MNEEATSETRQPFQADAPTADGIGLALSGGGFRATLFHLGSLIRLNELGLLSQIDSISAVSGGSILSGLLASRWNELDFVDGTAVNLMDVVFEPIWAFCGLNVDVKAGALGLVLGSGPLERRYRRDLIGDKTLQDLPGHPEFVFNAAHLETGRNWTFTKARMGTYLIGYVDSPNLPIAKVVAASSACPPFFAPVRISLDSEDFRRSTTDDFARLFTETHLKDSVALTDGGTYDNLGIHAIRRFRTILVSDASGLLQAKKGNPVLRFIWQRSIRPTEIAVEQTRALRRQKYVGELSDRLREGAFWALGIAIEKYDATNRFEFPDDWHSRMASFRTRLNSFGDEEKRDLINWGYLQCDLSVRTNYLSDLASPGSLPLSELAT